MTIDELIEKYGSRSKRSVNMDKERILELLYAVKGALVLATMNYDNKAELDAASEFLRQAIEEVKK